MAGRGLRTGGWIAFSTAILLIYGLPVVILVVTSLRTSFFSTAEGTWSAGAYPKVLSDPKVHDAALNTGVLSVASTLIGMALAVFFAFVATRTRARLRGLITPTMLFLFSVPALFLALSWGMLGTPDNGLLNVLLDKLTGVGTDKIDIYSWWGLVWVTSLKNMALTYLLVIGPMRNLSRSLEEASLLSGSSRVGTFFRVQIPLLTPILTSAAILCVVASIEAFDIPLILGVPIGVHVISTRIFGYMTDHSPPGYAEATSLAVLIVMIMIVLVVIQWRIIARRSYVSVSGKTARVEASHLGHSQWGMSIASLVLFLVCCLLPLTQLVLGAFSSFFGTYGSYSLANFARILADDGSVRALSTTLGLAVGGGFATMVLAVTVTYVLKRRSTLPKRLLELPTWTPFAMPGIILALAFMGMVILIKPLSPLFGTAWLMLIALVVATTPIAARATEGGLLQLGEELVEAAKLSGAGHAAAARTVVVPLISGSFLYGWFIVGVAIAGNLQVPILLSTTETTTAAVLAYQYNTNGDTAVAAATFCLVLVALAVIVGVAAATVWTLRALAARRRQAMEPAGLPEPARESEKESACLPSR